MSMFGKDAPLPPRQIRAGRPDGSVPLAHPRDLDPDPLAPLEDALRTRAAEINNQKEETTVATDMMPRNERLNPAVYPTRTSTDSEFKFELSGGTLRLTATAINADDVQHIIEVLKAHVSFFTAKSPTLGAPTLRENPRKESPNA
jgi:hypothetical protein